MTRDKGSERRPGGAALVVLSKGGIAVLALMAGCQGDVSSEPPVHVVHNMDDQQYVEAQESHPFFRDGRGSRPDVPGTVAVGRLRNDDHRFRGRDADGDYVDALPAELALSEAFVARGRERFNIFCGPCHDEKGTGLGVVVERGMVPPPNFHLDQVKQMKLGYFFEVISQGVRNMPAYKAQIPVDDRWAIASYIRGLQKAGPEANLAEIPKDFASRKAPGQP